jgi:hypothetical protein
VHWYWYGYWYWHWLALTAVVWPIFDALRPGLHPVHLNAVWVDVVVVVEADVDVEIDD